MEKPRNKTMALHASTMTGVRPAPINGTGDMKDIGINFVGSVHFDRPPQDGSIGPADKVMTLCGPSSSCKIAPVTGFNEECRTWFGPVARLKLVYLSDTELRFLTGQWQTAVRDAVAAVAAVNELKTGLEHMYGRGVCDAQVPHPGLQAVRTCDPRRSRGARC